MAEAAARAARDGVRSMVGFTYRRVPAIGLARQLVADGRLTALAVEVVTLAEPVDRKKKSVTTSVVTGDRL